MPSLEDAMKNARAGSLARRPAIANVGPTTPVASPGQGGEFEGRTRLGGAMVMTIDRIIPDEDQPRKTFDDEPLGRLAENMSTWGQLVPILVRWNAEADRYVVIDGERRYRAARLAGLPTMACVVEDQTDPDVILEMQLVTNALREDVAPVEQARAWERLMKAQGLTHRELAARLGYDHTMVNKSLALLDLTPSVQELVDAGKIPASTAVAIGKRLDPADQQAVVDQVITEGLSRARAVEVADQVASKRTPSKPSAKGKAKVKTSWKFKASAGLTITAERARGVDPRALLEALEVFAAEVRAGIPEPTF